ncbi:hypothetical protein Tco_1504534 [Tanacetum coccineum]
MDLLANHVGFPILSEVVSQRKEFSPDFKPLRKNPQRLFTVSIRDRRHELVCPLRRILEGVSSKINFDSLGRIGSFVTVVPTAVRGNLDLESTGIFLVASARRRYR